MDSITNYEDLANAIILDAVIEYRIALKCLQLNPKSRKVMADRDEIEAFFRSDWFSVLTSINGERLIAALNLEVRVV